jgi:hypothetical protein
VFPYDRFSLLEEILNFGAICTAIVGQNLPFPERKKAAYLDRHSCYLMANGSLCPLMRLNLSVMSLINRVGMVLLTLDPLMVAGIGLMVYWLL